MTPNADEWQAFALPIIKKWEGLKLRAYKCPAGVWTIGYGTTGPNIKEGLTWTAAQCEAALLSDVREFAREVRASLKVKVSARQFAALVSLAYNIGINALRASTLLRKLNAGDYAGAAEQFPRWNRAGGRELQGLTNRRAEERALFEARA